MAQAPRILVRAIEISDSPVVGIDRFAACLGFASRGAGCAIQHLPLFHFISSSLEISSSILMKMMDIDLSALRR
jgi:hypothetical protein